MPAALPPDRNDSSEPNNGALEDSGEWWNAAVIGSTCAPPCGIGEECAEAEAVGGGVSLPPVAGAATGGGGGGGTQDGLMCPSSEAAALRGPRPNKPPHTATSV